MAIGNNIPPLPEMLQDRRIQIGVGVAALIFILVLILFFAFGMGGSGKVSYGPPKILLKDVDQMRAIDISAYLKNRGINYEITQGEVGGVSILVPEKQYDDAIVSLAGNQIVNADDLSLFNKVDWASSDEDRRIKLIRALNGEASRIISRLDGVESAIVHINMPARKMFRSTRDLASANVSLKMKPGRSLNSEQVSTVLSIVRGYYAEIPENHISINDEKRIYTRITDGSDSVVDKQHNQRMEIEGRVQSYLDKLFGAGKASAITSISLNVNNTIRQNTQFTSGVIGSQRVHQRIRGNNNTPANTGTNKGEYIYRCSPNTGSCNKDYVNQDISFEAYPSYEQTTTEELAGSIQSIKISVIIDEQQSKFISIPQLKRGIAAASHPNITDKNVEVIIKPLESSSEENNTQDNNSSKNNKDTKAKFPWWKILLLIIIIIGAIILLGGVIAFVRTQLTTKSSNNQVAATEDIPSTIRRRQHEPVSTPEDLINSNSPFSNSEPSISTPLIPTIDEQPEINTEPPSISEEEFVIEEEPENNNSLDFGETNQSPEIITEPEPPQIIPEPEKNKPQIIIDDD